MRKMMGVLLGLTALLSGCTTVFSSGVNETRLVPVEGTIRSLSVDEVLRVEIGSGPASGLTLEGASNLLSLVEIRRDGDHLSLGLQSGVSVWGPATLTVRLNAPALEGLSLDNAASAELSQVTASGLSVTARNASAVSLRDCQVNSLALELDAASTLTSPGSEIGALSLQVTNASTATARVTRLAEGRLNAASTLRLSGSPQVRVAVTDASSLLFD